MINDDTFTISFPVTAWDEVQQQEFMINDANLTVPEFHKFHNTRCWPLFPLYCIYISTTANDLLVYPNIKQEEASVMRELSSIG
jgi:hypothetical protein